MFHMKHTQTLVAAGLTYQQAIIYELLLQNGPKKAGSLSTIAPFKRGLVYKTLDELVESSLVDKDENSKVAVFVPKHPSALTDFAIRREEHARNAKKALDGALGSLVSEFNLVSGKPGVQFFEGLDGVKKVLYDTLESTEEIYAYTDPPTVNKYIGQLNEEYVKERIKKKVSKKIISIDNPQMRENISDPQKPYTERRLIGNDEMPPFHTAAEIYDNKVVYLTFTNDILTATVITDPSIYIFHRSFFEWIWQRARVAKK